MVAPAAAVMVLDSADASMVGAGMAGRVSVGHGAAGVGRLAGSAGALAE
jgi:hypothetical protein